MKESHLKIAGAILFALLAIWAIRVGTEHLFGTEGQETAKAPPAAAPAAKSEAPAAPAKSSETKEAPAAAAPTQTAAAGGGDAAAGQKVFQSHLCFACHSFEAGKNGAGPSLHGVFGAKAGEVAGFSFSDALKNSGLVFNAATLDKWVQGPQKVVAGTKMVLAKPVTDPTDRANLIAYIKQESSK